MATTQIARLTEALRAAIEVAEAAAPGDDGGSANLDCTFLHGRTGMTNAAVKKAASAAGVSVSRWQSRWWRGWMVHVAYHNPRATSRRNRSDDSRLRPVQDPPDLRQP